MYYFTGKHSITRNCRLITLSHTHSSADSSSQESTSWLLFIQVRFRLGATQVINMGQIKCLEKYREGSLSDVNCHKDGYVNCDSSSWNVKLWMIYTSCVSMILSYFKVTPAIAIFFLYKLSQRRTAWNTSYLYFFWKWYVFLMTNSLLCIYLKLWNL